MKKIIFPNLNFYNTSLFWSNLPIKNGSRYNNLKCYNYCTIKTGRPIWWTRFQPIQCIQYDARYQQDGCCPGQTCSINWLYFDSLLSSPGDIKCFIFDEMKAGNNVSDNIKCGLIRLVKQKPSPDRPPICVTIDHNPFNRHMPSYVHLSPPSLNSLINHLVKRHYCCLDGRPVFNSQKQPNHQIKMNKLMNNIFRRNSVIVAELPDLRSKNDDNYFAQLDYKASIELLNNLQTNVETIKQAVEKEKCSNVVRSLEKTRYFMALVGIDPEDLNKLNVIHVSGTKGKGSTCAFVESILRKNGFKTGFYSSPHLVAARERIRINGEPISEEKFAFYFSHIYNKIREANADRRTMPAYFNFLTIMAFHVFLNEKVDVAILEVGIGGEYDCTNVVPRPIVTGVTSLDLDHCKLLGNTIEQIAWQKGGIFKRKVPAFTVKQDPNAMKVLCDRAREVDAPLYVAPSWAFYLNSSNTSLGIKGDIQKLNASLAIQLAHYWLSKYNQIKHHVSTLLTVEGTFADVIPLNTNHYSTALAETKWLGRCEIIKHDQITYFLDAAHTADSMENCCAWFAQESHILKTVQEFNGANIISLLKSSKSIPQNCVYRILIFNCTGERDPRILFSKMSEIAFDQAIFTTNRVKNEKLMDSDQTNLTITDEREKEICQNNFRTWSKLHPKVKVTKATCITDSIEIVEKIRDMIELPIHVLICGSVHLVGGFIGLLHPDFANRNGK